MVRTERERVLEAMVRIAARKGYEATTVAEVAAAADISRQRFYELFGNKEACFLAAYDAAVDVLLAFVTSTFESAAEAPWPDRIVASLRAGIGFLAAEADIARMAVVEISSVGEDARIRYRQALMRFIPLLDQGRAASPQGSELPPDTASFAIGAVTSMIFDEIRAGRATELPQILPKLAYSVLMPYLGPEAAEAEMARIEVQEG
ncbi:MAG TPA: TetR/AcrR family transcriptional regulator [Solirubrobacterales bacterium]